MSNHTDKGTTWEPIRTAPEGLVVMTKIHDADGVRNMQRLRPRGCALGVRSTTTAREYECLSCGHVGWSAHIDLRGEN